QQEAPLLAKVALRQVLFGNAWEDMAEQARRQAAAFSTETVDLESPINAVWAPIDTRDEETSIKVAQRKAALGVPQVQLWSELGYDAQQIDAMLATPEVKARLAALQLTMALGERMDQGQ
ncbi:MAG TPA: hypothetical protein VL334_24290, partial [Anaerolineae bacterium]|nr:hypothetical protein [Anaerolineae bacterium]